MVFVIHWHESAMDLHVFPIPIPPPTSLSTRFLWVFPVHQDQALVSRIQPGLVICFTLDNIHVSMLFSRNIPRWATLKKSFLPPGCKALRRHKPWYLKCRPGFSSYSHLWKSKSVSRSVLPDSATPWTVARQAPLFVGFSRQEYWSGLPFPLPGDFPNPGIKPKSLAFQADSLDTPLPETLAQSTSWMSVYGAPGCRCPIIVTRLVFHSLIWPFMFGIKPTKLLTDAMSQDMMQLIFTDENVQDKKAQRKTVFWTPCLYVFFVPFYYVTRFALDL